MPKSAKMRSNSPQSQAEHNQPKSQEQPEQQAYCLYALMQVDRKASKDDIKKSYRKLVLQYHPDKNKDDPTAREKFQKLKEAYDILMDDEKRQQYDETGRVGDEFNESTFQNAYNYYRKLYKPISKQDIQSFEKEYRFGIMEQEDLLEYYDQHEGHMGQLLECIPLSNNEDVPRFIAFFEEQIELETIPKHKAFDKTKNKVRPLANEEKQFEEEQKRDMNALVLAIQNKTKANGGMDFISQLQKKYGAGKKQKIQKKEVKPKTKGKK